MAFDSPENAQELDPGDIPADSTWTCKAGAEIFSGETRNAGLNVFDIWYDSKGERVHAKYTGFMSVSDISYETDLQGVNDAVNGRALTSDQNFYSFKGELSGKEVDFSFFEKKTGSKLRAKIAPGEYLDIEAGTREYESAMQQLASTNFDPPCSKPEQ